MKMGLRRAAHELGLFWCREPDLKTEPAARRHQEVSPHLGGSTRGKVSDEGPPAARQPSAGGRPMQVAQERCCGLDVHKKSVVACVITPEGQEIRTFGTMTRDLLELGDWLGARGVTHVAMESTGGFWKPVYNLLEGRFALLVVNAQHIKASPGLKTDVKDAAWIADLLRHGLLRGSHIAERPERSEERRVGKECRSRWSPYH